MRAHVVCTHTPPLPLLSFQNPNVVLRHSPDFGEVDSPSAVSRYITPTRVAPSLQHSADLGSDSPSPPPPWWAWDTRQMDAWGCGCGWCGCFSAVFSGMAWIWHMMIGWWSRWVGGVTWVPRRCSWTWGWRWRSWGRGLAWCSWSSQCPSGSAAGRPRHRSSAETGALVFTLDSTSCSVQRVRSSMILSLLLGRLAPPPSLTLQNALEALSDLWSILN